ncbi:MAG TPA: S-layer homology domain-containing protein, partial [Clostridia bacterium]|nr:S-layer homology domain-containing protein [Clostridia bacterium]
NFADAGNTYYTSYLAMAKKMGITAGMNGNKFAPEREITRQEMFAMIYEIMKYTGNLPADKTDKTLNSFKDAKSIAAWAKDAMQLFVESGIVAGNKDMLSPDAKTTRAQFAQVLYGIFQK